MPIVYAPQSTPMGPALSSAPRPMAPLPPGAYNAQASGGLQAPQGMDRLVQALMQARTKQLLAGQLPGTTPQSLGAGTGMSDAASGPQAQGLSLGGAPLPGMVA